MEDKEVQIGFTQFLSLITHNPLMLITAILTLAVIMVNGWTDAPNAIATCVSTRALPAKQAILMAAIMNFFGVLVMTMINAKVAMTIYNMVDFGGNTGNATKALCAALVAIVVWAVAAWKFGIPTSESHALIAGLSGAAIALQNSMKGINWNELRTFSNGIQNIRKRMSEINGKVVFENKSGTRVVLSVPFNV